jgi:hypothetical protein
MAKSDLLKQAIADAKAVKETALANAKIALQEAFAPRLENVLQRQFEAQLNMEDEEMDLDAEAGMDADVEMDAEAGMGDIPTSVNVGLDFDDDGEYDLTGMLGGEEEMEADMEADMEAGAEAGMEAGMEAEEDDLNLEEILRELEEPMENEGMYANEQDEMEDEENPFAGATAPQKSIHEDSSIDEIIEAILREDDAEAAKVIPGETTTEEMENLEAENEQLTTELKEAYRTVKQLKSVINEVNLLNAKLLYTNKLFRNFDLNEGQKMKVIENFDRAVSPREAKLVFATLAESFNKPTQKRKMVKESAASRPQRTTAPSPQTTQILSEGFEMANRWKKLAGLI